MANKEARVEKKYEEYNWQDLYEKWKLSSLRVFELDKYIDHHRLSGKVHKMKKTVKVSLVLAHIAMTTYANVYEERELDDDNTSEDEDDIVLNEWVYQKTRKLWNCFVSVGSLKTNILWFVATNARVGFTENV